MKPMRGVAPSGEIDWNRAYLASPKIDGMRAVVRGGVVLSKTLKPIPNTHVQRMFGHLEGADGELTVGHPFKTHDEDDVFGRSRGPIMSRDQEADFRYSIFDRWDLPTLDAEIRVIQQLETVENTPGAKWLSHVRVFRQAHLDLVYRLLLQKGFEGVMLRAADGGYKYGQGTEREGVLLKFKPFDDSECVILGTYEQMKNTNAATTGADGHTQRSASIAGKVGKGTLGGFHVQDLWSGVTFDIGGGKGITEAVRQEIWNNRDSYVGRIFTYKFQRDGTKDKPRIPQFKGWRDRTDIAGLPKEYR